VGLVIVLLVLGPGIEILVFVDTVFHRA
jgi:hypothetical protein